MKIDIEDIEARVFAATRGPWSDVRVGRHGDGTARSHEEQVYNTDGEAVVILTHDGSPEARANVDLIVNLPTDINALLTEVRDLRHQLKNALAREQVWLSCAVNMVSAPTLDDGGMPYIRLFLDNLDLCTLPMFFGATAEEAMRLALAEPAVRAAMGSRGCAVEHYKPGVELRLRSL